MYYRSYATLWITKRGKYCAPESHKARSYEMPFVGFKNLVHLTKSYGSGLLLNILTDLSIIYRPILISYVSIAATRTYKVGHVGSCMYVCTYPFRSEDVSSFSNRPLFSSISVLFPRRDHKEETKLIRETRKIIRCMPRHVSQWHTTQEWLY